MAFVTVPVLRGITEIMPLLALSDNFGFVIAGGYARYCCSQTHNPEKAGDVDMFPLTQEACDKLRAHLVVDHNFTVKHENDLSISLDNPKEGDIQWRFIPRLQIIKPVVEGRVVTIGTVEDILNNFDFSVTRAALISYSEGLVDEDFVEDEKHKLLRLKNIHCPISSTLRCMKYSRKGYFLRATEALKLFSDWDAREVEYRTKLFDLLARMKREDGGEPNKEDIEALERLMRID